MKLPRNLPGRDLARHLERAFGYQQVHQEGSHIILQTGAVPHHRIPVPDHKALRLGTLNAILRAVARAHGLSKEEVAQKLLG